METLDTTALGNARCAVMGWKRSAQKDVKAAVSWTVREGWSVPDKETDEEGWEYFKVLLLMRYGMDEAFTSFLIDRYFALGLEDDFWFGIDRLCEDYARRDTEQMRQGVAFIARRLEDCRSIRKVLGVRR
jgi:hypothetical protein